VKRVFNTSLGLWLLCVSPAFAEYIEARPEGSAEYKVAAAVAQAGCKIDAVEWSRLIQAQGGSESDALWHISEMTRAGEAVILSNGSVQLQGVFGC
jgi:hypothetical protein